MTKVHCVSELEKETVNHSSKISNQFSMLCLRHERSLTFTGLALIISLAVFALGLIIAAGVMTSSVLLTGGIVLLCIAFIILSVLTINLALRKMKTYILAEEMHC